MAWSKQSRQERGYGADWDRRRKRAMVRDNGLCQPCLRKGRPEIAKEVDHIIPRSKGGTEDDKNLQAICTECHKAKTNEEQGRPMRKRIHIGSDGWPVE